MARHLGHTPVPVIAPDRVHIYDVLRGLTRGEAWPAGHHGRALALLLIGAVHFVFVFQADVLMTYAVVALIAAPLLARPPPHPPSRPRQPTPASPRPDPRPIPPHRPGRSEQGRSLLQHLKRGRPQPHATR